MEFVFFDLLLLMISLLKTFDSSNNAEVHDMVAPLPEHVAVVKEFLSAHGIDFVSVTPNEDFIQADVTFSQAEKLLSTKYHNLYHSESGHSVPRAMSYHLPAAVANALDFVTPTVHGSYTKPCF